MSRHVVRLLKISGGVMLILALAPRAAQASVVVTGAARMDTNTEIARGICACSRSASIEFLTPGGSPASNAADCTFCSTTSDTPPVTFSVGPTHVDASLTGGTGSVTFTANGNGSGSSPTGVGALIASGSSDGVISFSVSGQQEPVSIVLGVSVSGDSNSSANVTLSKDGVVINSMAVDNAGHVTGSIPSGGNFDPGSYALAIRVIGHAGSDVGGFSFNFSVTATVTGGVSPQDIHWNNPAGGDFNTAANWNPAHVPTSIDTAIFDLPTTSTPVRVFASNVGVSQLFVNGMSLELNGIVQVLNSGAGSGAGFQVADGGRLLLDSGATLLTGVGFVGNLTSAGATTVATVSGLNTRWTVGPNDILSVGFGGKLVVDQGGLLNAQKEIDVVGAAGLRLGPGALEVHNNALVTTPALGIGSTDGVSTVLVDGGGAIQAPSVFVGDFSGSLTNATGLITISGVSSDGTRSSSLTAGSGVFVRGGSIEVKDGGLLDASGAFLSVGAGLTGDGKMHVHGATGNLAAVVTASSPEVGSVGSSELVVEDGGAFTCTHDLSIGKSAGDIGTVAVLNTQVFNVSGGLRVGVDGQGTLNISSSAKVTSASGAVPDAFQPDQTTFGSVVIIQPVLPTSPDSEWDITGDCVVGSTAKGFVSLQGTPKSIFNTAFGATLRVGGTLTVGSFGSVIGNGKLVTGKTVNGGFIAPGLSPGVIEIDGDYEQMPGGALKMEAAGLNPGQFDVLHVTGSATLDGTLQIKFLNGYLPKTGDVIPFLQIDGNVTRNFAQVTFPQLTPDFQFKTEVVNGKFQVTALNDAVLETISLFNISTRSQTGVGDNVSIAGFVLQGDEPKRVLIRAVGPSLSQFNVPGVLADPTLSLFDGSGMLIGQNDNWSTTQIGGVITADQSADIQATMLAPQNAAESAIIATLQPGNYTAIVRGANGTSGVSLVEVYDVSNTVATRLGNISTRAPVQTADGVMIGGFVIGVQNTKVIVRAIGPSLAQFGVAGVLADPTLSIFNGHGDLLFTNDNWQETQKSDIEATGLAPSNPAESAIVATLAPGNYTAIVRGANNTTGVALVEVYDLH